MTASAAPAGTALPVSKGRLRINADLLFLSALVVLINLPYLSSRFVPAHDSRSVFSIFSYFYNHALVEHELPRWMAYGAFGIKSGFFQFYCLSASSYLFMLVGVLFGIQDSLHVFALSLVGEQLLFLLGVYLLSRRLFADRFTVFIVCFGAVCSTVWYWQLFFNFRMVHLLPLTLHFLFRFSSEKKPEFLWMTGILLLLAPLGCPPYLYPVLALTLLAVCIGLGSTFRQALPSVAQRTWRNGLSLALLVLTTLVVGLTLHQALDGIGFVSRERDLDGRVTLSTFLSYGGVTTPQIVGSFLGILPEWFWGADHELTHYIGLLPLAALPVAFLQCRSPYFRSLVFAAGLMLLLSLGGTFAALAHRLPLMGLFRHVGYVTPISKVLLLLASGFGIERFLSAVSSGLPWDRNTRFSLLAVVVLLLWILLDLQIGGERLTLAMTAAAKGAFFMQPFAFALFAAFRVAAYAAAAVAVLWPARSIVTGSAFAPISARKALFVAVIVDGLLFQAQVTSSLPSSEEPIAFPAGKMTYQPRRDEAPDPRTERMLRDWHDSGAPGAEYHLAVCSLFQRDAAHPLGRLDWASRAATRLQNLRGTIDADPLLASALGVTAPKLRLFSDAIYVDSEADAERVVSQSRALDSQAVLRGVPPELRFAGSGSAAPANGTVSMSHFSANRVVLDADVRQEGPAWLVYVDSFHPGWSATVNGAPVPIVEANLASKGVRLDKGKSIVCFTFHDGVRTLGAQALSLLSLLFMGAAFAVLFGLLFTRKTP
jgi:hypothetical protein